jgi:hypothetical protein
LTANAAAKGAGPLLSGVAPNYCADVWMASRTSGAPVVGHPCNGGANQQFALQPSGEITVYDGALCLDVWMAQANDGDRVVAHACNGGRNQKWVRTAAGELQTAVNGKCLDVPSGKPKDGARLTVFRCTGGTDQKWTIRDAAPVSITPTPTPTPTQPVDTAVPIAPPIAEPIAALVPASTAPAGGSAELPRVYLDTRAPAPTGRTISVPAGGDLQGALDAAAPGDVVVVQAGATFVGNFVLRPKPNAAGQWITVRTSGTLPAEGSRVSPALAGQMPKILTPNAAPALGTAPGAQGWRLMGLEVSATPGTSMVYSLVNFGDIGSLQNTATQIPSRLVIDRSFVHGTSVLDLRRCVTLNSASSAVIDSYISDCHSRNSDSQAIWGWNGPGPFKITNNRLEGGHEGLGFGGADPNITNLVPSDVEIRRNHVIRPLSWRGVWPAKNLFELKAGRRVLVEGNVFENNWPDAQNGFTFLLRSYNPEGSAPWTATEDITFRYNRVRNIAGGFDLHVKGTHASEPLRRVTIAHNVFDTLDPSNGRFYQITGGVAGVTIVRNTGVGVNHDVLFITPEASMSDFVFRDNITGGQYPLFAAGGLMGAQTLSTLRIPAGNVTGNVFVTTLGHVLPSGNVATSSLAAVGFASPSGGDYQLTSSSAYRTSGTGGITPGADVGAVATMIQGVVP